MRGGAWRSTVVWLKTCQVAPSKHLPPWHAHTHAAAPSPQTGRASPSTARPP